MKKMGRLVKINERNHFCFKKPDLLEEKQTKIGNLLNLKKLGKLESQEIRVGWVLMDEVQMHSK